MNTHEENLYINKYYIASTYGFSTKESFMDTSIKKLYIMGSSQVGYIIVDITDKLHTKKDKVLFNKTVVGEEFLGKFNTYLDLFSEYEHAIGFISMKYYERKRKTDNAYEIYKASLKKFDEFSSTMQIYRDEFPELFI